MSANNDESGLEIVVEASAKPQAQTATTPHPLQPGQLITAPPEGALNKQTWAEWLNRSRTSPYINKCLMPKEIMDESMEVILNAVERFPWDNKQISAEIKRAMDERLGATWHVVVGESFSFEIAFESDLLLYLFYGSLGILVWKCGTILMREMRYKKNRML